MENFKKIKPQSGFFILLEWLFLWSNYAKKLWVWEIECKLMSCHIIRTASPFLYHSCCFWFLFLEPEEWGVFLPFSEGLKLFQRSWLLKSCHLQLLYTCLSGWGRDESLQLFSWVRSDNKKERQKALIFIMQASAFAWNTTQVAATSFNLIMGHQSSFPMLATPVSSQLDLYCSGIIPSPHTNIQESKVFLYLFPWEDPVVPMNKDHK